MDLSLHEGDLQEKSCHNAYKSSCGSFLPPSGPKILSQGDFPGDEEMSSVFRAFSELAID